MSMNLYIEATRKAYALNGKGKRVSFNDRRTFDCWQTPTKVTYDVLAKKTEQEKVETYVQWADSAVKPYEDNMYDFESGPDDNLDYPVIGRKMIYPAQEHANALREFLKDCHEEGFSVKFYTM